MVWIVNLLLTIVFFIWSLWVSLSERADMEAPLYKWLLKCMEAKEKTGKIFWNEFLAIMKYLCLHYINRHEEAEHYLKYTDYVDMTPFTYENRGKYTEDDWDMLVNMIYGPYSYDEIKPTQKEKNLENYDTVNGDDIMIMPSETIDKSEQEKSAIYKDVDNDNPILSEEPQLEEPKVDESLLKEETTYEWEEKKMSKTWLWVLLAILIVVGVVFLYFSVNTDSMDVLEDDNVEFVDTVAAKPEVDNNAPKNALAFIEEFYKGDLQDEAYIKKHVTASVLTKLKNDFDYDCPSNNCLATWVFTAYPAGADMNLEEGPTITSTDKDGVFKLDFWYSFYDGYKKGLETRSVYLTITNIDGRYLISDYLIKEKESNITEEEEFDEAAMMDNLAKRNLEANGLDENGE